MSDEIVCKNNLSPFGKQSNPASQTSDGRLSGIPDDGLHHLWAKVEKIRDKVFKVGQEVLDELLTRRNTIAQLGRAIQTTDTLEEPYIKVEKSDDETETPKKESYRTPKRSSYKRETKSVDARRSEIISNINTLAEVQAIAHQFDNNMIPPANLDMRTHVESVLAGFEATLFEIEKQIEFSRQNILENTTQRAVTLHANVEQQMEAYLPIYEQRVETSEARLEEICEKKQELLEKLELCIHGSPTINVIERKLRSLSDEEAAIRGFLEEDGEHHRNVLHYANWMHKFTKPDHIPKCLSNAFARTGRHFGAESE